jgi:peptidoglycan-N-acetylglucosamine deacetylase
VGRKKSFIWPKGILIGFAALSATLCLGLIMPVKPNVLMGNNAQTINVSNVIASQPIQPRIEGLKDAMLTSWQQEAKTRGLAHSAPKRFEGATIEEAKLTKGEKVIALTFDDGPWPTYTAEVLDILKTNNIKGTFFVVGQNLKNFPDLGKRVVAEGHIIANHTWHHWYHYMNPQAAAYEIDHTSEQIYQITGVKTNLFRPPGGIMNNGVAAYARNKKYALIMWSSDSNDYSRPGIPRLINNVMKEAKPGGIVLMHDGGGNRSNTVKALPQIIENFRKQGYKFVTIPELLEMEDKERATVAAKK